jgi:hypothetical protein
MPLKPSENDLDHATPEELLQILAAENETRRRNRKLLFSCLVGGAALLIGLQLISWLIKGKAPDDFGSVLSLAALIGAGMSFTGRHQAALRSAQRMADPRLAGFLVEAYATNGEKPIEQAAREGLLRSLPMLDDPEMLDPYQRGLLYKIPGPRADKELTSAALGAIGRVAGPEAIPYLERFRAQTEGNKDPERRRLADLALQILPDVRIRAARAIIERRAQESRAEIKSETERIAPSG